MGDGGETTPLLRRFRRAMAEAAAFQVAGLSPTPARRQRLLALIDEFFSLGEALRHERDRLQVEMVAVQRQSEAARAYRRADRLGPPRRRT